MYVQRLRTLTISTLITLVVCIGIFGNAPNSLAAETFFTSDKSTEYAAPMRKATFAGNNMVWMDHDTQNKGQIFSRNLETGELKQITDTKDHKEFPSAGGDFVVYLENRQNIVLLNLQSGTLTKAAIEPSYRYDELQTDGRYVTYLERSKNMLYIYDTTTEQTHPIGKGSGASIVGGVVVYFSSDSSIDLYNANTGTSKQLYKASRGYLDSTSKIAFNGKNVVWTQSASGEYQTRMLYVDEINPLPQVLNVFKEMPNSMDPIVIGTNIAAWPARIDGTDRIVAADLASRQTDIVTDSEQLIGIYQDQLVLQDKENKVLLRTLQLTGQGQSITTTLVSAVPDIDMQPYDVREYLGNGRNTPVATKDNSVIVSGSAELITDDNSVSAPVSNYDYFYGNDMVGISYAIDSEFMLTKALQSGQKMVSHPWNVSFDNATTGLKLSMSYMEQRVPPGQQNKLGIYRLESGGWAYIGGLFEENKKRLYSNIIQSGIYVVLYYDVPDPFIRDYWLQKRIEQLNVNKPIRVFLDGEEVTFHQSPVLQDGSTTVEFRPIFEKLGLQIDWDDATQSVTGAKRGQSLRLTLGQTEAFVNDVSTELPTSPFLNQGYTFVPLRFVGEATGRKVLWDANLKAVYLYDPATEGKLYYENGALMYEGQLKNERMNGKGKLYREDGSLWYDAEFRDNEVIGWGTLYFAGFSRNRDRTGEVSIGQFENGLPQGYVIDIDDSSYVFYEGQVDRGIFNGNGKYYLVNQLIYEGEFKDNLFDGYGKYYIGGKLKSEGHFVKNTFTGYGKEYSPLDGSLQAEGEYVNDALNGKGIMYYTSGAKSYEGEFVDGRKSNGTFFHLDGKVMAESTIKADGTRTGTIYYTNGEKYVGDFIETIFNRVARNGQGTQYDRNDNVIYQGNYQFDEPQQ
jgi:hypothetical protein